MIEHKIEICMGSSCFIRGNNTNLEIIKKFLDDHNLNQQIELIGRLCQGNCKNGPIITINQEEHQQLTPDRLLFLLGQLKKEISQAK